MGMRAFIQSLYIVIFFVLKKIETFASCTDSNTINHAQREADETAHSFAKCVVFILGIKMMLFNFFVRWNLNF